MDNYPFTIYKRYSLCHPELAPHNVYLFRTTSKLVDDHGVYRVDVDPTYQTVRILARVPAKTPIECPRNVAYGLRYIDDGSVDLDIDDMTEAIMANYNISLDELKTWVQSAIDMDGKQPTDLDPKEKPAGVPISDAEMIALMDDL